MCRYNFSNIIYEVAFPLFIGVDYKENVVFSDQPFFLKIVTKFIFIKCLIDIDSKRKNIISSVNARSEYKTWIRKCRYNFDKAESIWNLHKLDLIM
jgi:glucosamine 6-phosphate synthetase-like amidotransferase/phosphosugar isomerase protein